MTPVELLGGIGFILFFFASIALVVIVLARLAGIAEAWVRSRRATTALKPEKAARRRAASVPLGGRFSTVDTTHRRELGRRR